MKYGPVRTVDGYSCTITHKPEYIRALKPGVPFMPGMEYNEAQMDIVGIKASPVHLEVWFAGKYEHLQVFEGYVDEVVQTWDEITQTGTIAWEIK